jgi:protein-L-isoaspartate(D-aspartate) O-methyltransferase
VPIDAGQTISQPYMVALMTELLAVRPGDRVLELGTGSGYQAAVLAWLGADVISLERHHTLATTARDRLGGLGLADRVDIRVADGSLGDRADAPFDGIIVTAAAPAIPVDLREQLADGGRLVIPVGSRSHQVLMRAVRRGDDWVDTPHGGCVFVPLVGPGGFAD